MVGKSITFLSVLLCLIGSLYISNAFELMGIHITVVPYCSLILMLVLVLVFLIYPFTKGGIKKGIPWYDILLILMSICSTAYIAFFPARWGPLLIKGTTTPLEVVLCFMLVVTIIEATRRTVNIAMAFVALFFVIHLIFGSHFPGLLMTFHFSPERIASIFYLRAEGIFGTPIIIACTIIVAFMLLAAFLQKSEAGRFILDSAFALTGRQTGGPAKVSIIASSALGTLVGATAANVASTGSITIPLMKKSGCTPEFAGAVECVASNGGQIMPPVMGAVAFLIAELLGMPYWSVCVAAFLPAFLYYVAVFVQVHFEAKKLGLLGLPREQLPSFWKVLKQGWFYMIPILLLLFLLAVLHLPVQHCGFYAALTGMLVVIINWQRKRETRKGLKDLIMWLINCLETAARMLLIPAVACAAAGLIIGSLDSSGLGLRLSSMLLKTAGGNLFLLLLLTAFASFILGMGMTSIPCYLVLVILVTPALVQLGVVPIAAHLFVFYFGLISFITPPVAVAAYIAAGISGGDPIKTGFIAMRLAIASYIVPFLFIYNPSLLMMGSVGEIIVAMITNVIGIGLLGITLVGFFLKKLTWWERLLFMLGGLLLLVPMQMVGWFPNGIGGVIVAVTFFWHLKFARKATRQIEIEN